MSTTIFVIEGLDNFDHENYVKDATYSETEARAIISNIEPNGSLPDSYQMNKCILEALKEGKVISFFTHKPFDKINVQMILDHLKDKAAIKNKLGLGELLRQGHRCGPLQIVSWATSNMKDDVGELKDVVMRADLMPGTEIQLECPSITIKILKK